MDPLRFHQETLLFFLLLFLLAAVSLGGIEFRVFPSHPLKAVRSEPQEDGGFSGIRR